MVTKPLALLCGLALLASSGLAPACTAQREDFRDPDVERARGVGETREYDIAARFPLTWQDDHTVVFATWTGTATIDLNTDKVVETADPSISPPNDPPDYDVSARLPVGAQYGPWEVTGDMRLYASDTDNCHALLVSPTGAYVACKRIVHNPLTEQSEAGAAVIRLR